MTVAPGLCSITFRTLSSDEVVDLATRGVAGIEWGSDVHAPPGGGPAITALGPRARDAGLAVVSYGSYLGMAPSTDDQVDAVLASAEAMGAPMVRIWAELGVTPDSPADDRRRVTEHTAALVDRIAGRGLVATLEFHPGTLTETAWSTNELLEAVGRTELRTHWQPDPSLTPETALDELAQVAPGLAHLHVFSWGAGTIDDRWPLADGAALWAPALALADREGAPVPGGRYALCEYVRGDDPEQFVADARALRSWIDDSTMGGNDVSTSFPDGFLWGAATAGHQVEGGNVNADIWPLEWAEPSMFAEPSGDACDHYHRYPEDIAIDGRPRVQRVPLLVEWARIEPGAGLLLPRRARPLPPHVARLPRARHHAGGDLLPLHDAAVVRRCRRLGAAPAPDRFARYADEVTEHLGDLCRGSAPSTSRTSSTMLSSPA